MLRQAGHAMLLLDSRYRVLQKDLVMLHERFAMSFNA